MQKIFGEIVDVLCLIVILVGTLYLFSDYFSDSYLLDSMEYLAESFLDEAERKQSISKADYEAFRKKADQWKTDFQVTITLKCKRVIPQYEAKWEDEKCFFVYIGNRKEELLTISYEEFLQLLEEKETLVLERGDCILVCIEEGCKKRSLIQKIIRW